MGYVYTFGLSCRAGSNLVALLGSKCKAGRRGQTLWREAVVFIFCDMPASYGPQKLQGGRSKAKRRCELLLPYYESVNAPIKTLRMAKLHLLKDNLLEELPELPSPPSSARMPLAIAIIHSSSSPMQATGTI
jgi:hypothetical protein